MADFQKLADLLIERNMTVCAAESCTGGAFAAGVVSVPDASRVLEYSFVTYSEAAKHELVGVPTETIDTYGVVSEEVARAMARGAAAAGHADVGVGITGFAGPSGGTEKAPVGTVCFGFCLKGDCRVYRKRFVGLPRNEVRARAVDFAADKLTELLENG
ncbi:MAG: CinA family protein [Clostridia bacterium]|nr:CinA family protein [Clostridia bacterium]